MEVPRTGVFFNADGRLATVATTHEAHSRLYGVLIQSYALYHSTCLLRSCEESSSAVLVPSCCASRVYLLNELIDNPPEPIVRTSEPEPELVLALDGEKEPHGPKAIPHMYEAPPKVCVSHSPLPCCWGCCIEGQGIQHLCCACSAGVAVTTCLGLCMWLGITASGCLEM